MVAANDQAPVPPGLAERLRALRERQGLTQGQIARALGGAEPLSVATVSLWEKPGSSRLPPPQRLAAYARLFCSDRSFGSEQPRLLREDELTEQERQRAADLYGELLSLRDMAQSGGAAVTAARQRGSFWRFADPTGVSVVGSDAPERPRHASRDHLNYCQDARFADLDALIEVFGQVRADNPSSRVRILPPERLTRDFALNDLVIIGGAAVYDTAPYFATEIPLPVARPIPETDTHLFECSVGDERREFRSVRSGGNLVEDVGVVARGAHPNVSGRTVTIVSGITSRGVHGAALCFTDRDVSADNEQYLNDAFGNAESFCIVMRVPVRGDVALPPNLQRTGICLYEWSAETGARW